MFQCKLMESIPRVQVDRGCPLYPQSIREKGSERSNALVVESFGFWLCR